MIGVLAFLLISGCSSEDGGEILSDISIDTDNNTDTDTGSDPDPDVKAEFAITDAPPINIANVSRYELGGTCTGKSEDSSVQVNLGLLSTRTSACENSQWSVRVNVRGLLDAESIPIVVTEGDVELRISVMKDTQKPQVGFNTPTPINSHNQGSYSISGTCSSQDIGQEVIISAGGLAVAMGECGEDGWTVENYDVNALTVASVSIVANMKDVAGNPADEANVMIERDVVVPTLTITTTDLRINAANKMNYVLEGSCSEEGKDIIVKIPGLSDTTISCTSGAWRFEEDASSVQEALGISFSVGVAAAVVQVVSL